ncbi:hypothetical protein [Nocardia sp. NPDC051570]|uniref:hypothetical protein n=1 Tax=Nocardia sp. NPDC051570 TaxID=3364324 RepID=UPI0037A69B1C
MCGRGQAQQRPGPEWHRRGWRSRESGGARRHTDYHTDRTFERGALDYELLAERLTELRTKTKQLQIRRDELTFEIEEPPRSPEPATLGDIADHIAQRLGVAHTTIRATLHRRGIPRRETHSRPR